MDPAAVAQACGDPAAQVTQYLPHVVAGLEHFGISDHATRVAAFATCAVEMDWEYLTELDSGESYNYRQDLGNIYPGDGPRYKGRGFVQVTGRGNYQEVGNAIGVDLVNNPELACDPHVAGLTLAYYFKTHNIPALANAGNWYGVRAAVNGTPPNGLPRFYACVGALLALPDGPTRTPITTVAVRDQLRQKPIDKPPDALDAQHRPVVLEVGTVVHFCPEPAPGPYHGKETTPNWAHVMVGAGPIHGWLQRANLKTD